MPQRAKKPPEPEQKSQPETLTGWRQIAAFLGQPPSTVQQWAPKECRFAAKVVSSPPLPKN
jgi:hypothetical protein